MCELAAPAWRRRGVVLLARRRGVVLLARRPLRRRKGAVSLVAPRALLRRRGKVYWLARPKLEAEARVGVFAWPPRRREGKVLLVRRVARELFSKMMASQLGGAWRSFRKWGCLVHQIPDSQGPALFSEMEVAVQGWPCTNETRGVGSRMAHSHFGPRLGERQGPARENAQLANHAGLLVAGPGGGAPCSHALSAAPLSRGSYTWTNMWARRGAS